MGNNGSSRAHQGRLELTWTDKDKTLLSADEGKYDYTFVDPTDWRVSEVRLLDEVAVYEKPTPEDRPAGLPHPISDNLLITGDSMHVLDALAKIPDYADKYLDKVKLVYIDPPFNTGKVFTKYEDNITHSIWLTMLRDRLRQIRPLLAPDASVWVHLDDAEMHRCRAVMDEELGPENFVGTVIWGKADTSRNDAKQFSTDQDYILVYSRKPGWRPNRLPRRAAQDAIYSSPDEDPRPWLAKPGHAPSAQSHQGMVYAIQSPFSGELLYPPPSGCWRLGEDRMWAALNQWAPYKKVLLDDAERRGEICDLPVDKMRDVEAMLLDTDLDTAKAMAERVQEGVLPEVYFINDGTLIQVKGYKPAGLVPRTFWPFKAVGSNRNAKAETKKLFPGKAPFDTPKPERLIQRIIHLATEPGDVVLDCFAGSGTTAAVAHKMGRRWVTSELLPSTMESYTKLRLERLIAGTDKGSITEVKERVAADGVHLPSGVEPDEAYKFQQVLRKVLRTAGENVEEPPAEEDEVLEDERLDQELREEVDQEPEPDPEPVTIALDKALQKVLRAAKKDGNSPLGDVEVRALNALLRKVAAADLVTVDITKDVRSSILKKTKTTERKTRLWHGGGGFTHLQVRRSMFVVAGGMLLLAEWATQSELSKVICAQLSVRYAPDGIFAGKEGRTRYVVIDGMVGTGTVEAILDRLEEGEAVEVWATQIGDGAADALKSARPGSSLHAIPAAVLDSYRRAKSSKSPFRRPTSTEPGTEAANETPEAATGAQGSDA